MGTLAGCWPITTHAWYEMAEAGKQGDPPLCITDLCAYMGIGKKAAHKIAARVHMYKVRSVNMLTDQAAIAPPDDAVDAPLSPAAYLLCLSGRDRLARTGAFKDWCRDHEYNYNAIKAALSRAYGDVSDTTLGKRVQSNQTGNSLLPARQLSAPESEPAEQFTTAKWVRVRDTLKGLTPQRSLRDFCKNDWHMSEARYKGVVGRVNYADRLHKNLCNQPAIPLRQLSAPEPEPAVQTTLDDGFSPCATCSVPAASHSRACTGGARAQRASRWCSLAT